MENVTNNIWSVIVTYNAINWISKCLESLQHSSIRLKVIIVDNASIDGTPEFIKTKFSQHTLINNDENLGFGKANNIGINCALQSGAEFIVLLNQDARLEKCAVEHLVNYSNQYPEYGILAPMFFSYDGKELDEYVLKWIFNFNLPLASDIFFNRAIDLYDVQLMPAAMWLIKKEAILDAGGFDPLFFMYKEDDDLWMRFKQRGWKAGLFPKAVCFHHSPSNNYTKKRVWLNYGENILILKSVKKPFSDCFLEFLKKSFTESCIAILKLNKSHFYVTQKSFFKVLFNLRTIRQHRRMSQKLKMPFLENFVSST